MPIPYLSVIYLPFFSSLSFFSFFLFCITWNRTSRLADFDLVLLSRLGSAGSEEGGGMGWNGVKVKVGVEVERDRDSSPCYETGRDRSRR